MKTIPVRWTHTATLTRPTRYGPRQFDRTAPAGTTVELFQDPAIQEGDLISIRIGRCTGVARLANLTNVQPVR